MGSNETGMKLLDEVFAFETSLARITTQEGHYERMKLGEFVNRTGLPLEWTVELLQRIVLLDEKMISLNQSIISHDMEYIEKTIKLFMRLRIDVQASYLIWRCVQFMAHVIWFV